MRLCNYIVEKKLNISYLNVDEIYYLYANCERPFIYEKNPSQDDTKHTILHIGLQIVQTLLL